MIFCTFQGREEPNLPNKRESHGTEHGERNDTVFLYRVLCGLSVGSNAMYSQV